MGSADKNPASADKSGKADYEEVRTDTLNDGTDGQAWETLREIGYEKGDFYPIATFGGGNNNASSTSSSYSTAALGEIDTRLKWDSVFPPSATTQVVIEVRLDPGSDQIDARLRNQSDNETILENTGVTTTGNVTMGPTSYTPPDTSSAIKIQPEIRNSDGTTTVKFEDPTVYYGVEL